MSLSTIIPTLSGYIFWNETVSPLRIAGIVLMFVCFFCSVDFDKNERRSANGIWLACVAVAFVTTGLIGGNAEGSSYRVELDGFLIIAFGISVLYSVIIFKEKLSLLKWIGFAIGTVAVVLLCM